MANINRSILLPLCLTLSISSCVSSQGEQITGNHLAGTRWQLLELQPMSDAIGISRPEDPSLYTMTLNEDGTVNFLLNCNRANGNWTSEASSDESGSFTFTGPLAMTRALCPPGSLDERIGREAQFVRTYLLREGRLYLSLMADGGIQVWEPLGQ